MSPAKISGGPLPCSERWQRRPGTASFTALASSTGLPLPNHAQQLAITSSFQLAGKGVRASVRTASKIHTFLPHPHITEASAHLFPHPQSLGMLDTPRSLHGNAIQEREGKWTFRGHGAKGWISQRMIQGMLGGRGPTTQLPRPQKFVTYFICILLDWPNSKM